jgi:hypothetical protein
MITAIYVSPKKTKRYRVYMNDNTYYDFGYKGGSTYIDHKDKTKRENYLKRHLANPTEYELIDNLVPSPSLFSAYLLWGRYTNLMDNIKYLNKLWAIKHKNK